MGEASKSGSADELGLGLAEFLKLTGAVGSAALASASNAGALEDITLTAVAEDVQTLVEQYLQREASSEEELLLLSSASHCLLEARACERPSLTMHAARLVLGSTLPKLSALRSSKADGTPGPVAAAGGLTARYHDNGLCANLLQVLDALFIRPPGTKVFVDWRREGSEGHFQYGHPGLDLWSELFENSESCCSKQAAVGSGNAVSPSDFPLLRTRLNPLFSNMCRGWLWTLPTPRLESLRSSYYRRAVSLLKPTAHVLDQVELVCSSWTEGVPAVGVHKRQ
eukprot:TRINITY_DN20839_c0_g1_i1.p1 TRINITY_DN20839_c0_g1~~TRINITY_DN20839_c0_g1_i1.p1  ORF type:complete len:282 (-),score=53.85 TRINITY_DN20839_c0_g1_i1:102-947(-)